VIPSSLGGCIVIKRLNRFLGVALVLLVIASGAFAVGPWVMEWYSFDVVPNTGTHAEAHAEDWLLKIYGKPEADFSLPGNIPGPDDTVMYEGNEMGWFEGNLVDENDDRNLSNGIYEGAFGDMSNYVYYGVIVVTSPEAQDTVMHVAQDDELKVWCRGELIAEDTSWTGGATTTRPHNIHLKAGQNVMLFKVSEEGGGDYLNVQFDAEDLTFAADYATISTSTSVSPAGSLSATWGSIKILK
jgi:hypothetical protein